MRTTILLCLIFTIGLCKVRHRDEQIVRNQLGKIDVQGNHQMNLEQRKELAKKVEVVAEQLHEQYRDNPTARQILRCNACVVVADEFFTAFTRDKLYKKRASPEHFLEQMEEVCEHEVRIYGVKYDTKEDQAMYQLIKYGVKLTGDWVTNMIFDICGTMAEDTEEKMSKIVPAKDKRVGGGQIIQEFCIKKFKFCPELTIDTAMEPTPASDKARKALQLQQDEIETDRAWETLENAKKLKKEL